MNLTTARQLVEKHLTDRCLIERDRAGVYDDVLDISTMKLLRRPEEPEVIYDGDVEGEGGPCLIAPVGIGQTVEGARVMERRGYRVRLPYDAPIFLKGDRLTVVMSDDAELVGRLLVVVDSSQGATMDVGCTLNCQEPDAVAAQ